MSDMTDHECDAFDSLVTQYEIDLKKKYDEIARLKEELEVKKNQIKRGVSIAAQVERDLISCREENAALKEKADKYLNQLLEACDRCVKIEVVEGDRLYKENIALKEKVERAIEKMDGWNGPQYSIIIALKKILTEK